jgi:tRNA A-37 threonylcarbamoyl transferase component Bud32
MLLGGRYRLVSTPVSNGSFGAVYAADDERMPRRVAIKILHAQHASNVTVRERFRRELAAVCRVQHENVVSVFDVGEDERLGLYYVMELVQGTPLRDRISETPPPWPFVFRVASQLGSALCAIHAANIVHRDLKPQNIMLVERPGFDELVKVLDFGIASIRENNEDPLDAVLTGARNVLGTPPYMAPEQTYMRADRLRLGLDVDARSDIYALGVVLYEMVAGRRPFSGDAHSVVLAHRNVAPVPLERMAGIEAPKSFLRLVMQCLEKRPEDRPQSARAFLDALLPTEHGRLAAPVPDAVIQPRHDDDAPTEMFSVENDPLADWQGRRRRKILAFAGLGALVAAGAAVLVVMANDEPVQPEAGVNPPAERVAVTAPPPEAPPVPAAPPIAPPTVAGANTTVAPSPPVAVVPASLVVTSVPADVEVIIDGVVVGVTPLTREVPVADAGAVSVKLELRKTGFEPREVTVAITPDQAGKVVLVNETLVRSKRTPAGPAAVGDGPAVAPPVKPKVDPFADL